MKKIKITITTVFILSIFGICANAQDVIRFQDWEGDPGSGNWMTGTNVSSGWVIGTAVAASGNQSAYVTPNNGTSTNHGYDVGVARESYAYTDIDFPASPTNSFWLRFDWQSIGEATTTAAYDYMRVFLVETTLANPVESNITAPIHEFLGPNKDNRFVEQASWTSFLEEFPTAVRDTVAGGTYRLVFTWKNNDSASDGTPAAIDNILVTEGDPRDPGDLSSVKPLSGLVGMGTNAYGATAPAYNFTFRNPRESVGYLEYAGMSGDVTFEFTDASYTISSEDLPLTVGEHNHNITFKPRTGVSPNVVGSESNDPGSIFYFDKTDNVTIDGSNNGTSSRDLTISNISNLESKAIFFGSDPSTTAGSNNNIVIKNCVLSAGYDSKDVSMVILFQGRVGSGSAQGRFDNILIENNDIQQAGWGINLNGGNETTNSGSNITIRNNKLDNTGADQLGQAGIRIEGVNAGIISGNAVGNISGGEAENDTGIELAGGCQNLTIEKNEIYELNNTNTQGWGAHGLSIRTGMATPNIVIRNNMIYDITGIGYNGTGRFYADNPAGFRIDNSEAGNGQGIISLYHNTVYLRGNTLNNSEAFSAGVGVATGSSVELKNNIIINNLGISGTGGGATVIGTQTGETQVAATSDYNFYYCNPSGPGNFSINSSFTTRYQTIDAWKAANTNRDRSSSGGSVNDATTFPFTADNLFTLGTKGNGTYLKPNVNNAEVWLVNGMGVQMAEVSDDFEGTARSNAVVDGPTDLGAFEVTPDPATTPAGLAQLESGTLTAGSTMVYTVANRPWIKITWGSTGTLPSSIEVRHYSGTAPPNPYPSIAEYFQAYTDVTATGGTGFTYDVEATYDPAIIGNVPLEGNILLAKYSSGVWATYTGSTVNTTARTYTKTGLDAFSSFTGSTGDAPLPVELLGFEGKLTPEGVALDWVTASEFNHSHFEIERADGAGEFQYIGEHISTGGESNKRKQYGFLDETAPYAEAQTLYYRLKQVDVDGSFSYSKVVSIELSKELQEELEVLEVQAYPNPFSDKLNLRIPSKKEGEQAQVELLSITGQSLWRGEKMLHRGNNIFELPAQQHLPKGTYILRLQTGAEVKTLSVIKRR